MFSGKFVHFSNLKITIKAVIVIFNMKKVFQKYLFQYFCSCLILGITERIVEACDFQKQRSIQIEDLLKLRLQSL